MEPNSLLRLMPVAAKYRHSIGSASVSVCKSGCGEVFQDFDVNGPGSKTRSQRPGFRRDPNEGDSQGPGLDSGRRFEPRAYGDKQLNLGLDLLLLRWWWMIHRTCGGLPGRCCNGRACQMARSCGKVLRPDVHWRC